MRGALSFATQLFAAQLFAALLLVGCDRDYVILEGGDAALEVGDAAIATEQLGVRVVRTYPHVADAFTQGLVYAAPWLYESTGLYGQSSLRRVDFESGAVDLAVDLDSALFGEGLALVNDRLIQLTWREGRALVWNAATLTLEREISYTGEGWGLCYDGTALWMSDGSATLWRRDPETFELLGSVLVEYEGRPVDELNELECVGTEVLANVWRFRHIVRIDSASGRVTGWIEAGDLLEHPDVGEHGRVDVLNGIAFIPEREHLLLTGKLWPRSFEVELVPASADAAR